ncbi:ROK family protein [Ferdinandcohnia sp. Marseille-Q9671]
MYLGIDVGGTKLQFAVGDGNKVTLLEKIPTPGSYEAFLECIENVTFGHKIEGVGLGIPATFTEEIVNWAPNIPYLENRNLKKDIATLVGSPLFLGNDAQMSLLGEMWKGAGHGRTDAVLMCIGTGIGGAIMVSGKLVKGRRGAAGAFGWTNLNMHEPPDQNHGFLERHASGTALASMGQEQFPPLSPHEIGRRARQGDGRCLKILGKVGHLLGVGLASIASTLDPEVIIISGGLSDAFDLYEEKLKESFIAYSAPGIETIPVIRGQLGNTAGAYGAIRLAEVGDVWA